MLFAIGWAIVRSSREPYRQLAERHGVDSDDFLESLEALDRRTDAADEDLFRRLERRLSKAEPPDLDWHFRRHMNNDSGILQLASSRNQRGAEPTALALFAWLAENGPGSYGLVYLHDDEDLGDDPQRDRFTGEDLSNVFRVWRLLDGRLEELEDPFLSPIVPRMDPSFYG